MRHDGWSCSGRDQPRSRPHRHASICIQSGLATRKSVPKVHAVSSWPECPVPGRAGENPWLDSRGPGPTVSAAGITEHSPGGRLRPARRDRAEHRPARAHGTAEVRRRTVLAMRLDGGAQDAERADGRVRGRSLHGRVLGWGGGSMDTASMPRGLSPTDGRPVMGWTIDDGPGTAGGAAPSPRAWMPYLGRPASQQASSPSRSPSRPVPEAPRRHRPRRRPRRPRRR